MIQGTYQTLNKDPNQEKVLHPLQFLSLLHPQVLHSVIYNCGSIIKGEPVNE